MCSSALTSSSSPPDSERTLSLALQDEQETDGQKRKVIQGGKSDLMIQGEQKRHTICTAFYIVVKQILSSQAEANVSCVKQQHNFSFLYSQLHHLNQLHTDIEYVTFFS